MSDDDKRDDSEAKSGQLIPGKAPLPLVAPTGQQRTLARLLSMLSTWPFRNRVYVEKLKTAKEVYEAKNELAEAIERHGEIRERLKDFGTTRDRGREERSRLLYEEKERRRAAENIFKHEVKMQDEKNRQKEEEIKRQQKEQQIQRMEQEKRELLLAKELEELRKPPPPPPEPPKKTTRGRSPKQKARDDAYKSYEKEIKKINAMRNRTAEAKEDLKKAAAKELEIELEKITPSPDPRNDRRIFQSPALHSRWGPSPASPGGRVLPLTHSRSVPPSPLPRPSSRGGGVAPFCGLDHRGDDLGHVLGERRPESPDLIGSQRPASRVPACAFTPRHC